MRVQYPAYYEKFSCIAGECEDTCCAGWEIDIDEDSYAYYMSLPGEFGQKVRRCLKTYDAGGDDVYEAHGFILQEKKRCPFLREDGLCEMILALGEDAICDVCAYTPRNFLEYGGIREISISPSCAEAGRLIFGSEKRVKFVTREEEGELDITESEEECLFGKEIRAARDYAIAILQGRDNSMAARMAAFLCYSREVQRLLNSEGGAELSALTGVKISEYIAQAEKLQSSGKRQNDVEYLSFLQRFSLFSGLDSINEEWEQYLQDMDAAFVENAFAAENYGNAVRGYACRLGRECREYEWEHLAVYFAYLMLSRCVDDWNFWGKAQFVAVSWLFVRDMDALRYFRTEDFTAEDRVDVMRIFAKEVEHSQDNLDEMQEEFLFGEAYSIEKLLFSVNGIYG